MRLATPDGEAVVKNDFVFALTGYRPDLPFLNSVGITLDPATLRPKTNPGTLESECPGIYLAGRHRSGGCTPTKSSSKTAASTAN